MLPVALGIGAFAFGPGADPAGAASSAPGAPVASPPPSPVVLSHDRVSYWAYPQVAAKARATPSPHARVVGRLHYLTPDGLFQAQVYQALRQERGPKGVRWIEVSLPGRPNGKTGWVRAGSLGSLHVVYGLILVDLAQRRLTFYSRTGSAVFTAPVGIGRPSLPTPTGHFYVLERWRMNPAGFLGPFGFGTSAYAPTLTDWPGGGVVGIHGTSEPWLIPGNPSHGCVRLRNGDITRLWGMVAIGTAIEIK